MHYWLGAMFGMSYLGLGSLVPYLALTLQRRGVDGWILTAALGALPFSRLVVVPVWSILADRFQAPTRMVRLGGAIAAAGAFMLMMVPSDWWVVVAMFILAIGRAPAGPVLDGLTLKTLPDRKDYGRVRRWGSVGFMIGVVGVGWLVDYTTIGALEAVTVVSFLFLVLALAMPSTDAIERVEILPALKTLVRDPFVRWIIPAAAFHFAPHVGNTSFIAVHIDGLGHGAMWTGWAIAGGLALEIFLMGLSARILSVMGAERLLLLSMVLAIPRWALMTVIVSPWLIVLVNTIHGITFGMFWIAGVTLMNQRAPAEVTTSAQGLFSLAVGGIGSTVGVMGASWIVTNWDTTIMYSASTVCGMLGLLFALMAVRR